VKNTIINVLDVAFVKKCLTRLPLSIPTRSYDVTSDIVRPLWTGHPVKGTHVRIKVTSVRSELSATYVSEDFLNVLRCPATNLLKSQLMAAFRHVFHHVLANKIPGSLPVEQKARHIDAHTPQWNKNCRKAQLLTSSFAVLRRWYRFSSPIIFQIRGSGTSLPVPSRASDRN
jgi:hypothetical protein